MVYLQVTNPEKWLWPFAIPKACGPMKCTDPLHWVSESLTVSIWVHQKNFPKPCKGMEG
jgi:hypothetical protein